MSCSIRYMRTEVAAIEKTDGPVEVADLRTGLLADHGKMAWMLGPRQDSRPADGCYSPKRRGWAIARTI